jgi:hypothetical protein
MTAWLHEREKERERRRTCKLVTVSIRPHVEAQRIGYHLKESMYNRRKKELQYLHVPLLSEIDVILSERHQTIRLFIKLLSFLLCSGDQTGDILTCSVISFPSRIGKYWDSSIVCKEKKKTRTISTTQVCYFLCSLDEQLGLLHRLKGRKKAWHTRWSYQISQIWPYSNLQYYPHEPFWLLKFSFSLLQILCCFPSMIFRVAALFTLFHCTWLRCCNFTIHGKSRK